MFTILDLPLKNVVWVFNLVSMSAGRLSPGILRIDQRDQLDIGNSLRKWLPTNLSGKIADACHYHDMHVACQQHEDPTVGAPV